MKFKKSNDSDRGQKQYFYKNRTYTGEWNLHEEVLTSPIQLLTEICHHARLSYRWDEILHDLSNVPFDSRLKWMIFHYQFKSL